MSRIRYIITYGSCPIRWWSKLQTEIALPTTESEYIAILQLLVDVFSLIELLKDIREVILSEDNSPVVHCTVFRTTNAV